MQLRILKHLQKALELMGAANNMHLRDDAEIPAAWVECCCQADRELGAFSEQELDDLALGEFPNAALVERAPVADRVLDAAFEGELTNEVFGD